ncbi:thiopeptide-type bacteriocin biosynthesis protein [Kribbella solani]|uniref:Thiopeptide-type bacteriocin biosynthesis protein n=1 Tax=Kribbella solani TaxID=236067 RepID=A0A841DNL0_9ACTN|nr:thiopeptide-type bacteriocin biosynthesis protein [Kribbella solani]
MLRLAAAPAAAAAPTRTAPDPATATATELSAYLREVLADASLLEAIELSSSSLAASLQRILAGADLDRAKLERAVLATTRYLLRMTGRPTPFGLLAGVAPVTFDSLSSSAKVRIGSAHTRQVLPDEGWLHAERRGQLPERVVANSLAVVRGDRLVLPYLRKLTEDEPGRELSLANSEAVQFIRTAARRPIAYEVLRARLLAATPDATPTDADKLLGQLITREILLGEYADVGDGAVVQVDLRVDADVRLPQAVADEAARVGSLLWRLSPPGDGLPALASYHRAFLDRYGTDRVVPVLDLLDPQVGLGPPAGYRIPLGERGGSEIPSNTCSAARDQALAAALAENAGTPELVLDDELVEKLVVGRGAQGGGSGDAHGGSRDAGDRVPDSLDLCAQVLGESPEALERGEFLLAATSGSIAAGAMIGRFAGLLGVEDALGELYDVPGPLPVQLKFAPYEPRFGNVLREPQVLPHTLAIGTFADPDDPTVVDVRDVCVGTTGERLYLFSKRLGRELAVVRPNMLNVVTGAPNVARFLAAVGLAGRRFWTPWQWGRLEVMPRLPRVRSGRSILAPALWRTDPELATVRDQAEWDAALDRWRERLAVPDVIRVGMFDHHLDLDLRVPLHRRLLRDQLRKEPSSVVSETLNAYGVTAGHANELVVPLVSVAERPEVGANPSWRTADERPSRYLPGGEWLSAKIYLAADLQDALLAGAVRELVARMGVDRWFFLRYRDPDAHLRIRFRHGDPAVLNAWAAELVEAGRIRTVVLDEYEPEVARYGGAEVMAAAEDVFCADSRAVLEQLSLRAGRKLAMPVEWLAALNQLDLLAGFGELEQWFLETYAIELANAVSPKERADFVKLQGDFQAFDCWGQRRAAVERYAGVSMPAVMSVLHLHNNRLLGTDRTLERRAYGLARAALKRRLDRQRHM